MRYSFVTILDKYLVLYIALQYYNHEVFQTLATCILAIISLCIETVDKIAFILLNNLCLYRYSFTFPK